MELVRRELIERMDHSHAGPAHIRRGASPAAGIPIAACPAPSDHPSLASDKGSRRATRSRAALRTYPIATLTIDGAAVQTSGEAVLRMKVSSGPGPPQWDVVFRAADAMKTGRLQHRSRFEVRIQKDDGTIWKGHAVPRVFDLRTGWTVLEGDD